MEHLQEYLPILVPVAVIQLALMLASLIHILRHKTYRFGNRPLWIVLCLVTGIIGPVLYFAIEMGDE